MQAPFLLDSLREKCQGSAFLLNSRREKKAKGAPAMRDTAFSYYALCSGLGFLLPSRRKRQRGADRKPVGVFTINYIIFMMLSSRLRTVKVLFLPSTAFHVFSSSGGCLLTLFRLGGRRGGVWRHPDLKPLLLTNDCVYSVPTSWLFLKFTWEQIGVVRFW